MMKLGSGDQTDQESPSEMDKEKTENEEPGRGEGQGLDKDTDQSARERKGCADNDLPTGDVSLSIEDEARERRENIHPDTSPEETEKSRPEGVNREEWLNRQDEGSIRVSVMVSAAISRISGRVPARHVLAVMTFLGCVNLFTHRVDLSVALVAMVKHTSSLNSSSNNDECDVTTNSTSQEQDTRTGEFNWDAQLQGHVLGSFFYGYCVTQILGGWLAGKIGGKRVFGASVCITSILTLLTPAAASLHVIALIGLRVLQGMAQGVAFPSIHCIWSTWAPVRERSRLVAFSYAGAQMGTVVAMPVTGLLCKQPFLGGWPAAFYVFGVLGVAWCIVWAALIHDSPNIHPRISQRERNYILQSTTDRQYRSLGPPWKAILTTPAVWAIIGAHFAYDWGCFTTLTMLPQFMYQVLKFDITQNGGLSALPYLVLWGSNTVCGPLADCLRIHHFSTKVTRKIMNSIGLLVPAVLILGVGYVGCDPTLAVTLLTLGVGMSGFTLSGFSVNHIDIAPRFAGILMGISNSFGTTSGFIGPVVVGALTNENHSLKQWRIFFLITAAIYAFGGLIFLLFSEGEVAEWAQTDAQKQDLFIPQRDDATDSTPQSSS